MRKAALFVSVITMVAVLALYLAGCGGNSSSASSDNTASSISTSVITPSSLVAKDKQIVFVADDVAKDAKCRIYVIENGEITFRSNYTTALGDVVGLSDEEVEELFKQEEAKLRNEDHDYQNVFYEFTKYPKVSSIELRTDKSGNNVEGETIVFDGYSATQISKGEIILDMSESAWSHSFEFELFKTVEAQPIFDGYFGGFSGNGWLAGDDGSYFLVRVDSPESATFEWDPVGTEGTTAK